MNRALTLSVLLFVYIILGIFSADGRMLALSLPMILALGFAIFYSAETLNISAERTLNSDQLQVGESLFVTVNITNNGGDLAEVHLSEVIPRRLKLVEGDLSLITSLKKGETVKLEYELSGPRGSHQFAPISIAAADRLGLYWRKVSVSAEGDNQLLYVMASPKVGQIKIHPRQTRSFAGYIPARVAGAGIDFFGVREYRQGDSQRHINWRATARHPNNIHTNQFEQDRVADVGLILDARTNAVMRAGSAGLFEHLAHATDATAEAFLSDGNRVSLLIYGKYLEWTFPGYGRIQRQKLKQKISNATYGSSEVFENLGYLPTRLFPTKSQIVMFSSLIPGDEASISQLRARGYSVLVISPDPVSFEAELLEQTEESGFGRRIAHIERELTLRKLRQSGVQVASWNVNQPIKDLIKSQLQKPIRHGAMRGDWCECWQL